MQPARPRFETHHTIRNPNYKADVAAAFKDQAMLIHLGAELTQVAPGYCEIRLPFRPELGQNHGYFHGGAVATLADVSGGFAGWTLLDKGQLMLTVEYKTNIVSPGQGEALIGRGWVVKSGRTLTITQIEVHSLVDGVEQLCATALQTLMMVKEESP